MENPSRIIRTIIGAEKANTHALALSVEVMADLLFGRKSPWMIFIRQRRLSGRSQAVG